MQFEKTKIKEKFCAAFRGLVSGRIARTTFVQRLVIFAGAVYLLFYPIKTFLSTSTRFIQDGYVVLFLSMLTICIVGFLSASVKRLHDIGLRGYWAIPLFIGIPAILGFIGEEYTSYRIGQDSGSRLEVLDGIDGADDILLALSMILPLMVLLWKSQSGENRFGHTPEPVEHVISSYFNIIVIAGTAAILIPTCIYVGLFQSGIWVGRGSNTPSLPWIDSNSEGRLIAKCWNIKGVGAGSGKGPLGGVYRDGYDGSVLDFLITDEGLVDVVPAGKTFSKAYRAEGFEIYSYGLDLTERQSVGEGKNRFTIAAIYEDSSLPDGGINFTTFSFARTGEISPEWQMVMSSGLSQGEGLFTDEQARGRLMIGDCVVS